MKTSTFFSSLRTACIICLLLPSLATAQSDTLTFSGTFQASSVWGDPGPDLDDVYANGHAHTWTLTMQAVTYEQDYSFVQRSDGYYDEQYITRARSISFTLEFFGPDGSTLNSIVGNPLTEASVELVNGAIFDPFLDPVWTTPYIGFSMQLSPADPADGVQFLLSSGVETEWYSPVHPTFEPQEIPYSYETIVDQRFGGYGEIQSYSPAVYIGTSVPPPPPPSPTISIADGSVLEGKSGTRNLTLPVTLSNAGSNSVTVYYRTINGTASSVSDYVAVSQGSIALGPGQTTATIAIAVKGDRKREPNETFTVELFNVFGATINDGIATATILNDD